METGATESDRMAQENPNRMAEWLVLLRRQVPIARQHVADWYDAVKEEPILIWQTPAVRYATYGIAGALLVWFVSSSVNLFVPPPPSGAKQEASTADYHVVCSDPACRKHFVIHRKFGFRKFPVACSECKQKTGAAARRCNSTTCRGVWVAPIEMDGVLRCSRCNGPLE